MAKEVRVDNSNQRPEDDDLVLLEAVELELTLQSKMPLADGCETAVREALAGTSGSLLFHMRPDAEEPGRWVGAVLFAAGGEARVGVVTISEAERTVSVETAEQSDSPLARIAPAYAAVLAHLQTAA
jgi:hypothetical protein